MTPSFLDVDVDGTRESRMTNQVMMGLPNGTIMALSQWLFPLSSLRATPSRCPVHKELYDRARGVEFLFRLGASLGLSVNLSFLCPTSYI